MRYLFKKLYFFSKKLIETIISFISIIAFSSFKTAWNISRLKEENLNNIHILANGPSLKTMLDNHLYYFQKHDTLVVNFFANSPFFDIIKPKYYVLLDRGFWGAYEVEEISDKIPLLFNNLAKVSWKMTLYVPYSKNIVSNSHRLLNNPNITIVPFCTTRITGLDFFRNWTYKLNLGIASSKNVLLPSMHLMLNKGYKKIYLYGAEFSWTKTYAVNPDNGNIYTNDAHFYDNTCIPLKKGEFKFNLNCLVDALEATEYYEKYANYINSQIINRTPGSFIDAFIYQNPKTVNLN